MEKQPSGKPISLKYGPPPAAALVSFVDALPGELNRGLSVARQVSPVHPAIDEDEMKFT
jgi:hypothetical protein